MKNKGFSMVEIIIVVAILAILTGFLAPMLMKYVTKARLSADLDTGREIAQAILNTLTDDAVKDNAVRHATPQPVNDMDGNDFKKAVFETLGVDELKGKTKKDVTGRELEKPYFYYTLDVDKNKVEVYYGGISEDYQIYPVVGTKLLKN